MTKMVNFTHVFYHNKKKPDLVFKDCLFAAHTNIPLPYGLQPVHRTHGANSINTVSTLKLLGICWSRSPAWVHKLFVTGMPSTPCTCDSELGALSRSGQAAVLMICFSPSMSFKCTLSGGHASSYFLGFVSWEIKSHWSSWIDHLTGHKHFKFKARF